MKVYVVSLNRPHNVAAMEALAGPADLVWCVPEEQIEEYALAGAKEFWPGPPSKYAKVNAILDALPEEWLVFTDDDCQGISRLEHDGSWTALTLGEAAEEYVTVGQRRKDAYVCPTQMQNKTFLSRTVSNWAMTSGWFNAMAPGFEPRYDEGLSSSGDTDLACQVMDRYGRICRVNWMLMEFRMADSESHYLADYKDKGPVIDVLLARWPHLLEADDDRTYLKFRRL